MLRATKQSAVLFARDEIAHTIEAFNLALSNEAAG